MDQDEEGEKVEQNLLQDGLSGEKNDEKSQRVQDQHPGQESLPEESEVDEEVPDEKQDLGTRFCRGSSDGCEEGTDMIWRSVQTPSQPLQQMTVPETQEWTPIQTRSRARDQNCPN